MKWLDKANMQFSYPLLFAGANADWRNFYTSNLSVKTELLRRFAFNEEFPYAAMEDTELGYRIKRRFGLEVKFVPEAVADHLHLDHVPPGLRAYGPGRLLLRALL